MKSRAPLFQMEQEQLQAFDEVFGPGNYSVSKIGAGLEYQMSYDLGDGKNQRSGSFSYTLDPERQMRFWGSTFVIPEVRSDGSIQTHAQALAQAFGQVANGESKRDVRDRHDVIPAPRTTQDGTRMAGGANDPVYMAMARQTAFLPPDLQFDMFKSRDQWLGAIQQRFPYADALPNMLKEGKFMPDARPVYDAMPGVSYDDTGVYGLRGTKGLAGKRSVLNRDPYSTFRVTGNNATESGAMRYTPVTVIPGMDVGHGAGFMSAGYAAANPIEWDKHFSERISIEDMRNFSMNTSRDWQAGSSLSLGKLGTLDRNFNIKGATQSRWEDLYASVPYTEKGARLIQDSVPDAWNKLSARDQQNISRGLPVNLGAHQGYFSAVERLNQHLAGSNYLMTGGTGGADTTREGFADSAVVVSGRAIGYSPMPTGYAMASGPDAKMVFAVTERFRDVMSQNGTREGIYTGNLEGIKSPENMIIPTIAMSRSGDREGTARYLQSKWGLTPAGWSTVNDRMESAPGVWVDRERRVPYYNLSDPEVAKTARLMNRYYFDSGRGRDELRRLGVITNLGREYSQTMSVSEAHKYEGMDGWTISPSDRDGFVKVSHPNPEIYNLVAQDSYVVRTITPGSENRSALPGHQIMESLHARSPELASRLLEKGFQSNAKYRSLLASYMNVDDKNRPVQNVSVMDINEKARALYTKDTGIDLDGREAPGAYRARAAQALYDNNTDMAVTDAQGQRYRLPSPGVWRGLSDDALAMGEDSTVSNAIAGLMDASMDDLDDQGNNPAEVAFNSYMRVLNNEMISQDQFRKGLQPYRMDEGRNATVLQTGALAPGEALYTGNAEHRELLRQMGINISDWNDNTIFMNTSYSGITQNADSDKDTASVMEIDGAMVVMRSPYTHGGSLQVLYAPGDKRNNSDERMVDALKSAGFNQGEIDQHMSTLSGTTGEERSNALRQIWSAIADRPMGGGTFGHINKMTDMRDAMQEALTGKWMGKAAKNANTQLAWGGSFANSLFNAASKGYIGIAYNSIQALTNAGRELGVSENDIDMLHRQVGMLNQQGLDRPPKNFQELEEASQHFGMLTTNSMFAGDKLVYSRTFDHSSKEIDLGFQGMKRLMKGGFDAASLVPFFGESDPERVRAAQEMVRGWQKDGMPDTGGMSSFFQTLYGMEGASDAQLAKRYMGSPYQRFARAQGINQVFKKLNDEEWVRNQGGRKKVTENLALHLAQNPEDAELYRKIAGFQVLTANNPVTDTNDPRTLLDAIQNVGGKVGQRLRELMPWSRERARMDANHQEVYQRAQELRDSVAKQRVDEYREQHGSDPLQSGMPTIELTPEQMADFQEKALGPLQGPAGTVPDNPLIITDKLEDPDDYLNTVYETGNGATIMGTDLPKVAQYRRFDFSGSGAAQSPHETNTVSTPQAGGGGRPPKVPSNVSLGGPTPNSSGNGGGTSSGGSPHIPSHVQQQVDNQRAQVNQVKQQAGGFEADTNLAGALMQVGDTLSRGRAVYDRAEYFVDDNGNSNIRLHKKTVAGEDGTDTIEQMKLRTQGLEPVLQDLTETFKKLERRASGLEEGFKNANDAMEKFTDSSKETQGIVQEFKVLSGRISNLLKDMPNTGNVSYADGAKGDADYINSKFNELKQLEGKTKDMLSSASAGQQRASLLGGGEEGNAVRRAWNKFSGFMENPEERMRIAGLGGLGWAMFAKERINQYMFGPEREDIGMYKSSRASAAYLGRVLGGVGALEDETFANSNRRGYYRSAAQMASGDTLAGFEHFWTDNVWNQFLTPGEQGVARTVKSAGMGVLGTVADQAVNMYFLDTLLKSRGGLGGVAMGALGSIGSAVSSIGAAPIMAGAAIVGAGMYGFDAWGENQSRDWRGGWKSRFDSFASGEVWKMYNAMNTGGFYESVLPGERARLESQYGTEEDHIQYGSAVALRLNEFGNGTSTNWDRLSGGLEVNDRARLASAIAERKLDVKFDNVGSVKSYLADLGGIDDATQADKTMGIIMAQFGMQESDIADLNSASGNLLQEMMHIASAENISPEQLSSYITQNLQSLSLAPLATDAGRNELSRILHMPTYRQTSLATGMAAFGNQVSRMNFSGQSYEAQSAIIEGMGQALNTMTPYAANWAQELYMPSTEYGYNLAISQGLRSGTQTMDVNTFLPATWARENALNQQGFALSAESALYGFGFSRKEMARNYAWDQRSRDRSVAWGRYQYGTQVQSENISMNQQRASFGRQMEMSNLRFDDMMAGQGHQTRMFGYQMQQQDMGWRHSFADMDLRASQAQESFGMQMRERGMQRNIMMRNYAFQEESMDISRDRQLVQRDWQDEDLAYGREMAGIQFAWGQEDSTRNIRLSTGRQRRELIRQRDRAEIVYGMEEGQRDRQEGRVDTQREWEDTDHDRGRKQFEEMRDLQIELFDVQTSHAQRNHEMQMESMSQQRSQLEEQIALQRVINSENEAEMKRSQASAKQLAELQIADDKARMADEEFNHKRRLKIMENEQKRWEEDAADRQKRAEEDLVIAMKDNLERQRMWQESFNLEVAKYNLVKEQEVAVAAMQANFMKIAKEAMPEILRGYDKLVEKAGGTQVQWVQPQSVPSVMSDAVIEAALNAASKRISGGETGQGAR